MMKCNTKKIVFLAVLSALITVFTMFVRVPTAIGYANLGDAVILFGALLFGPWAGIAAAIGSALADVISGYMQYALITFFIKGAMGVVAGCLILKCKDSVWSKILVFGLAELIMVLGYFAFESFTYGVPAATGSVIPNVLQGVVGILCAMLLSPSKKTIVKTFKM